MASGQDHLGLDWVKADLLETLDAAREALNDYAESESEGVRLQVCLTYLHQLHGTLSMLELEGVTQLAAHLELLTQALLEGRVGDPEVVRDTLMQGFLEMPGYIDELNNTDKDDASFSMPRVNEIRGLLDLAPLVDPAGHSLREGASADALARFNAIGGAEKAARMRSAFQNILLSFLRGEASPADLETLGKIASGLEQITAGAPLASQWQAFGEFVSSLQQGQEKPEGEALKLLRLIDIEIKNLAEDGDGVLRRPVNLQLVQQMLDAASGQGNHSPRLQRLQKAVTRDMFNNTLVNSGRQALVSAVQAVQEDLRQIIDKIETMVGLAYIDVDVLRTCIEPLNSTSSALSLMGLQHSRVIVSDQVAVLRRVVAESGQDISVLAQVNDVLRELGENLDRTAAGADSLPPAVAGDNQRESVAGALENIAQIRRAVNNFVGGHWVRGDLDGVPELFDALNLALDDASMARIRDLITGVSRYVQGQLLKGHQPSADELDGFAEVISAAEYYLERIFTGGQSGAEDILSAAELRLGGIAASSLTPPAEKPSADPPPDPEIIEIFVDEAREVLDTLEGLMVQWAAESHIEDTLVEMRRAFHTLKGSGKIVQADVISELSWAVENMLNRVIDHTVTANDRFIVVTDAACQLLPALIDGYAGRLPVDVERVEIIVEQADILASGGDIDPTVLPQRIVSPGAIVVSDEDVDGQFNAAGTRVETERASSAQQLFLDEAVTHLQVLRVENEKVPWALSGNIYGALHTLAGGAAAAQLSEVQLIVESAYEVAKGYRGRQSTPALEAFFGQAAKDLAACLTALEQNIFWDEPFELVAAADDLLAVLEDSSSAVECLLNSDHTHQVLDREDQLNAYLVSADAASISELRQHLLTVAGLAADANVSQIAALAGGLERALDTIDFANSLPANVVSILLHAYHLLIDQLNALAGGSEMMLSDGMLVALRGLSGSDSGSFSDRASLRSSSSADQNSAMDEPDALDPELTQVFIEEAEEICDALQANVLNWSSARENRLFMENMLRGLHTLKGGARLCGLMALGDFIHDFESVVIEVQSHRRVANDNLFVELGGRFDEITAGLAQFTNKPFVSLHQALGLSESLAETPARGTELNSDAQRIAKVMDVNKVVEAVVAPHWAVPPDDEVPVQLSPMAAPNGAEQASQETVRVGAELLEELVNLAGESAIVRARIEQDMGDFAGALAEMETTIERLRVQLRRLEIQTDAQTVYRQDQPEGVQYDNFDPLELDRYSQLQEVSRGLTESASDMVDLKETLLVKARQSEALLQQQARINTQLQEGLMRTRMVPFNRLLPRLRRMVRQVAAEVNKQVELHVHHGDRELDRNLLERMVAPLEHLLRNAVDHGIEAAQRRAQLGKAGEGRIDLTLGREGGDIVFELSDDGAGIDVAQVRVKATEHGLLEQQTQLSDAAVTQLVLAPGLSTSAAVTQISGRGVGLDVVHSEVKRLGGSISITSEPGEGTCFTLRVPYTVSVNRALMVAVGSENYAIPLNTIEGIVLLTAEQLRDHYNNNNETVSYAGGEYQLRYLGEYLGGEYHPQASSDSVPMLLVRSGDLAVAIHVDDVQDSREIVVKPLSPQFSGVPGISGATVLGDGQVVVILDLLGLVRAKYSTGASVPRPQSEAVAAARCVMVVDDSVTVRKVTSRCLVRQGIDVMAAKDGVEAMALLQSRRPDLILLDIEMPRMDGFEVARQLMHDPLLADLPMIMISSRTGEKHKSHALSLGVRHFLGKPFQESELMALIDELVPPG